MSQECSIVSYKDISKQEWNNFIEKSEHGWVTDHSDWINFFTKECGYQNHSFAIVAKDKIRMVFSLFLVPNLLVGKRFISGPFFDHGGPIVEAGWEHLAKRAEKHILELAKKMNIKSIEIRDSKINFDQSVQSDSYCNFMFELGKPEEEIFRLLGENVRRAIKKCKKGCSAVVSQDIKDLEKVWKLYQITMKIHGTPPWGKKFFNAFANELKKNQAHVILAKHNDVFVGGALVWGNGKVARLEISASPSQEAKKLQVNSFLFWQAIILVNSLGYKEIDITRTLKGSPHYDFKKRWGGQEVPLMFTYLGRNATPKDPRSSHLKHLANLGRYVPQIIMKKLGDPIRIRLGM